MEAQKIIDKKLINIFLIGVLITVLSLIFLISSNKTIKKVACLTAIFTIVFSNTILLFTGKANGLKLISTIMSIVLTLSLIWVYLQLFSECNETRRSTLPSEVQQYNAEFTAYDNQTHIKGSNVQLLIKNVITHNSVNEEDSQLWINVKVNIDEDTANNELEIAEGMVTDGNGVDENSNITVEEYNKKIEKELEKVKTARTYAIRCGYDPYSGYVVDIVVVLNSK